MKRVLRRLIPLALWPALIQCRSSVLGRKSDRLEIPIDQCVHYGGFRYGRHEFNPIETYLMDIHSQVPLSLARGKFVDFLMHYRPGHMGEALGIDTLSRPYPMWTYPWDVVDPTQVRPSWCPTPDGCPDILTHFCETGILSYRIDEEFLWGERVLHSISTHGYRHPERRRWWARSGAYPPVRVLELHKCDGRRAYLLLDGNHRVGALAALGVKTVIVERAVTHRVAEQDCEHWYGVQKGFYTLADARRIFHAYFEGNHNYRTTTVPADIIGPSYWSCLYDHKNAGKLQSRCRASYPMTSHHRPPVRPAGPGRLMPPCLRTMGDLSRGTIGPESPS